MLVKLTIAIFLQLSCQTKDKRLSEGKDQEESLSCVFGTGWYVINYYQKGCERKMVGDTSSYYLPQTPLITSANVTAIDDMKFMNGTPGFLISFDASGTKLWERVTGGHVGDLFAFVLNDTLLTVGANAAKVSTGKAFFPLLNRSSAELQRIKEAILKR